MNGMQEAEARFLAVVEEQAKSSSFARHMAILDQMRCSDEAWIAATERIKTDARYKQQVIKAFRLARIWTIGQIVDQRRKRMTCHDHGVAFIDAGIFLLGQSLAEIDKTLAWLAE